MEERATAISHGSARLGNYLRRLRTGYGYSLRRDEERARAEGGEIDNSQLSRYEKGICYPSFDKLRVLASVFNVSVQAFSDVVDREGFEALKESGDPESLLARGNQAIQAGDPGQAGMEARMFNTRAAMNWDVPFVGHPSMASGELASLVAKPEKWKKVYAIGYKSCSYDSAGKLPPKSADLVARVTKANIALNDTLLWWIAGGIDCIELIAKAVAESGSTDSAGIVNYWNSLSTYPGYFGNYRFSPTQHNGYLTEEIVMSEASTAKDGTFALAPGYT